jgi:acyl-CoA thioesterase-1
MEDKMTGLRVCFVGDDLTTALGDQGYLGWTDRLLRAEERLGANVSFFELGKPGDTIRDIARRWENETAERMPRDMPGLLVFAFGLNDLADDEQEGVRVSLPEHIFLVESILRDAKDRHPVLWIGPPLITKIGRLTDQQGTRRKIRDERLACLNDAYKNLARVLAIPYLDLRAILQRDRRWSKQLPASDGVHPTKDGHALIAESVLTWSPWRAHLDRAQQRHVHPGLRLVGT